MKYPHVSKLQRCAASAAVSTAIAMAFALSAVPSSAQSQEVCKVLDEDFKEGRYLGPCKAGLAEGVGKVEPRVTGGTHFEGNFVAGVRQGKGRITFFNGDVYDGQWQDDKRWGFGVYVYGAGSSSQGDRYEGEWVADNMHGMGTYQWSIGDSYSGPWREGQQTGGATGWQSRRAAYLKAFLLELPKTQSHVCAASRAPGDPLSQATGYVRSNSGDRILVEPAAGGVPQWHVVSFWRPCVKKS
jgi:hypothetical protein